MPVSSLQRITFLACLLAVSQSGVIAGETPGKAMPNEVMDRKNLQTVPHLMESATGKNFNTFFLP